MMKRFTLVFAVSVLFVVIAVGCKSTKNEATVPATASQAQPAAAMPQPPAVTLTGKVVETMNSGGYTYISVENNGKKTWAAIPLTKVKVGQEVTCLPGMEMKNFTSKTMNRTFASILFSGGIR
jgi:hypothetical protein